MLLRTCSLLSIQSRLSPSPVRRLPLIAAVHRKGSTGFLSGTSVEEKKNQR